MQSDRGTRTKEVRVEKWAGPKIKFVSAGIGPLDWAGLLPSMLVCFVVYFQCQGERRGEAKRKEISRIASHSNSNPNLIFERNHSKHEMKSFAGSTSQAASIKFRMPTRDSLIPIRLDLDVDGHRYKDAFTWNPDDPDSEVLTFAKRTVKDLKLPPTFVTQISQSIQSQLAEFRSYGGQDKYIREKIVPLKVDLRVNNTVIRDSFLWDISNFESDPEGFARTLCNDLDVADPEVAPAIAVSIREQLFEIAAQSVSAVREAKLGKKGRRTYDLSKGGNNALDVSKYFGSKGSGVIRKRKDWYMNGPTVDILSNEEVGTLEELNSRLKRKLDEKEDSF